MYTNMSGSPCLVHNTTDPGEVFYDTAQFVTGLIIYPVLCFPGILGNILSLIVLFHKDMATSTNVYLSALAISDTVKLINDVLYFVVILMKQIKAENAGQVMSQLYPYAHYIFNFAVCVTAWLTVSIAIERYISVCHPTKAKSICTLSRARNTSISVFIIMLILSIPSALRYHAIEVVDTTLNTTCFIVEPTDLGNNQSFMKPYTWIQNLFRSIVPLVVLIFLNARIIHELKRERIKGKSLSGRNRITLIMIIIIIVFLVCITPDAVMSMFFGFGYVEEDSFVKGIREITDSLLAMNSAFNFVLYCTMSMQFRHTFCKIFGIKFQSKPAHQPERDRLLNVTVPYGRVSLRSSLFEQAHMKLQETFV
ncbi:FMRFamide receptor-like [Mya arenaria]|uniref:FMRFamide receptor-like n=1 Tax=Mya arenaria TaxID=6604 RepID=UPI0022E3A038|nr:FMRFamide receptor-like [Mya arenaria]XP_052803803.1 FMRFamide receptor-like [Mya arenaria]XP_052803804.1 FMRFamide receptor-like [Mya arenaria]